MRDKIDAGFDPNEFINDRRRLKAFENVNQVWPEPPPDDRLHIFVTVPPGGYSPTLVQTVGECFVRLLPQLRISDERAA